MALMMFLCSSEVAAINLHACWSLQDSGGHLFPRMCQGFIVLGLCSGTNLVDAEETTQSVVEDADSLPRLPAGAAGSAVLLPALQERGVQVAFSHTTCVCPQPNSPCVESLTCSLCKAMKAAFHIPTACHLCLKSST